MINILWLFLLPFVSSALLIAAPFADRKLKYFALLLSLLPLFYLLANVTSSIGSEINLAWIPSLGIRFHLSIDALSLLFLYLTAIIVPVSIMAFPSHYVMPALFYSLALLLQGLLVGFFTAQDLALFTFFWEAMLIPLYFVITIWGKAERFAAAFKFLIYMIAGSALMVAAVLALYFTTGASTFDMQSLAQVAEHSSFAIWICAIFLLAFAVKTPLFPFHGWLSDSYYQAPVAGTILLSALLSKAGVYGIARIGIKFFPTILEAWKPTLLALAIIGVLYGGMVAWRQRDYKRLIAYSSFAHVNLLLVGLFVLSQVGYSGAILQAFNHGITIAALFLLAGWLESKIGVTSIDHVSGLAKFMPYLCWFTLFFVLSSVALPGTNNFVGEILIFFALFTYSPWLTVLLGLTVILSVIYMLRFIEKIYFREPLLYQSAWVDIKPKHMLVLLPLIILVLWIGIYPSPILKEIESTFTLLGAAKP